MDKNKSILNCCLIFSQLYGCWTISSFMCHISWGNRRSSSSSFWQSKNTCWFAITEIYLYTARFFLFVYDYQMWPSRLIWEINLNRKAEEDFTCFKLENRFSPPLGLNKFVCTILSESPSPFKRVCFHDLRSWLSLIFTVMSVFVKQLKWLIWLVWIYNISIFIIYFLVTILHPTWMICLFLE